MEALYASAASEAVSQAAVKSNRRELKGVRTTESERNQRLFIKKWSITRRPRNQAAAQTPAA